MLSICVTIKNRSRVLAEGHELLLFPNCVRSIAEAVPRGLETELVVSDWGSDDWPLGEWLETSAKPIPVTLVEVAGDFSRGRGRNVAAAAAKGDDLLFVDADSLLSRAVVEDGIRHLAAGRAFFPVLFSFHGPDHTTGWWRTEGYGNCMLTRATFDRAGGWPDYGTWGREDDDFYARVAQVTDVVREPIDGFFHQWHPEDILWKDRYGDPVALDEIARSRRVVQRIADVVPPKETVVLVDESRFGVDDVGGRPMRPFLEENGEYAGVPASSDDAIRELERAMDKGATFLALPWISYWWLDHYETFGRYLHSNFPLVVDEPDVRVYRLEARAGGARLEVEP